MTGKTIGIRLTITHQDKNSGCVPFTPGKYSRRVNGRLLFTVKQSELTQIYNCQEEV